MAKLCVLCGGFCAYFLLLFITAPVFSVNGYYYYTADSEHDNSIYYLSTDTLQQELGHRLRRRDAQIESNQSNSPVQSNNTLSLAKPNETNLSQNQTEKAGDGDAAANKTLTDNKVSLSKTKLGKTTKSNVTGNATKIIVENIQKNLGVNGTGQRKNITTIKPVLLNNQTSTKIPPLKKITLTDDKLDDQHHGDEDEDGLPPDEDSEAFNKTLTDHKITNTTEDFHVYYNSSMRTDPEVAQSYWVDMQNNSEAKINVLLSKSHRRAATVQLKFEFPFYGHLIKNVTIATGGFLYTGDYVHSWLAATQYIAPLMANFDTRISNDSYIKYFDNGTAFTVEWEKVSLQDRATEGEFTFQATLHQNGDIVFVYKSIPVFIKNITDDHHPVKVGLSDAYIIDRSIFLVRRKTIYEYHRINFFKESITNWTVIYLSALPTCLQYKDCVSCISSNFPIPCSWCQNIRRCSTGLDRHRQDWLTNHCQEKLYTESTCSHISGEDIFDKSNITYVHDANEFHNQLERSEMNALGAQPVKMGVSSIVAILFLIAMVVGLGVWVLYAYRNPHTTSGQILIRYRPSQWRWRRGEARYTAATIHM